MEEDTDKHVISIRYFICLKGIVVYTIICSVLFVGLAILLKVINETLLGSPSEIINFIRGGLAGFTSVASLILTAYLFLNEKYKWFECPEHNKLRDNHQNSR